MDCAGPQCDVEKGEQQMTRIAIVEDEAAVREQLAGYVQRYTRQYGTPFEVTEFADGMEILGPRSCPPPGSDPWRYRRPGA